MHLLAKHLCVADLLDECCTIREEGVVRIACRPEVGAVRRHRQRQRFADEDIALKVHARSLHCGTHLDQRGEIAEAERHGKAALFLCIAALQEICGKFRREIQSIGITVHRERVRRMPELRVDRGEELPHLVVHGAQCIGAFGANERRIRFPVMQQVVRGEDVRPLARRGSLPIGGELCEELVVICLALHACEKIVKECGGSIVVLPKYAEIVCHVAFLSLVQSIGANVFTFGINGRSCPQPFVSRGKISPLFPIPRKNSRTRG